MKCMQKCVRQIIQSIYKNYYIWKDCQKYARIFTLLDSSHPAPPNQPKINTSN